MQGANPCRQHQQAPRQHIPEQQLGDAGRGHCFPALPPVPAPKSLPKRLSWLRNDHSPKRGKSFPKGRLTRKDLFCQLVQPAPRTGLFPTVHSPGPGLCPAHFQMAQLIEPSTSPLRRLFLSSVDIPVRKHSPVLFLSLSFILKLQLLLACVILNNLFPLPGVSILLTLAAGSELPVLIAGQAKQIRKPYQAATLVIGFHHS